MVHPGAAASTDGAIPAGLSQVVADTVSETSHTTVGRVREVSETPLGRSEPYVGSTGRGVPQPGSRHGVMLLLVRGLDVPDFAGGVGARGAVSRSSAELLRHQVGADAALSRSPGRVARSPVVTVSELMALTPRPWRHS